MRTFLLGSLSLLLLNCSPSKRDSDRTRPESAPEQPREPAVVPQSPAAIVQNMTLIGAEINRIELDGEYGYILHLELRTALPAGGMASLAEPGQSLLVHPQYSRDEDGSLDQTDERNQRLYQVRSSAIGDPLIGKISLGQDNVWYLVDTGLH